MDNTRRDFIKTSALAAGALAFGFPGESYAATDYPYSLPALGYSFDALEPYIDAKTMQIHHGKHHQAYVTNLNNLVKDTPLAGKSLEEVIMESAKDSGKQGIFNNAAQVWNHTFYWNSMTPNGGGKPDGAGE